MVARCMLSITPLSTPDMDRGGGATWGDITASTGVSSPEALIGLIVPYVTIFTPATRIAHQCIAVPYKSDGSEGTKQTTGVHTHDTTGLHNGIIEA